MIKAVTEAETTVSAHERRPSSALEQALASQSPQTCKPNRHYTRQGVMAEAKKKAKAKGKAKAKAKGSNTGLNDEEDNSEDDDDAWGSEGWDDEWDQRDNDTIEYVESQERAPKRARQ